MRRWYQILWGSRKEDELEEKVYKDADPDDLTIENAYKTRWIWYHTILAGLMFLLCIIQIATLTLLAVKL